MDAKELELKLNNYSLDKKIELLDELIKEARKIDTILNTKRTFNEESKIEVDKIDKNNFKHLGAELWRIEDKGQELELDQIKYFFLKKEHIDNYYNDYIKYNEIIDDKKIQLMESLKLFKAKKEQLIKENIISSDDDIKIDNGNKNTTTEVKIITTLKSTNSSNTSELRRPGRGELLEKCADVAKEIGMVKFVTMKKGEPEKIQKILIDQYRIDAKLESVKSTLRKLDFCKTQK